MRRTPCSPGRWAGGRSTPRRCWPGSGAGWGSFDASSLLAGFGRWLELNETDAEWVLAIARAFREADADGATRAGHRGELTIDGLLWLRHRVYDPASRAFLSTDPLPGVPGLAFATNPYHYAGNDPIGALDPLGLRPMTDADLAAYRKAASRNLLDRSTDWAVDNWEYLAAGGLLVGAALIGGPIGLTIAGGMVLGGGISAGAQQLLTGQVDWSQVAVDAVIGGAAGGAGAWAGGAIAAPR